MVTEEDEPARAMPPTERRRTPLPHGYRQGIITAITVLLGFSLSFFRYWGFEAPGEWTLRSILPAGTLVVAIAAQIFALLRSLRIADDNEEEYRKTVAWFIVSAVLLLVSLTLAVLVFANVVHPT